MKFKKIFMSAALLAGCLTASAQQVATTVEEFNPHWYVQAQIGGQYTLGEVDFSDLLSGNFQGAVGYNFTPAFGLRLAVDAWQSKGGTDLNYLTMGGQSIGVKTWSYNFIAPTLDMTLDVTNWIYGYKADRICNFGLLAGIGANFGWNNGDALSVKNMILASDQGTFQDPAHQMSLLWSGTKTRLVGKFGAYLDFKVSRRVALGLEVNCNATSDHYNSKKAGNADWYFNALAGVKVRLGKVSKTKLLTNTGNGTNSFGTNAVQITDTPTAGKDSVQVKNPTPTPDPTPDPEVREPLRRDIFFQIRDSRISQIEMLKVEDVANYLKKYPDAKVTVTGYADKRTGNTKLNIGYAQKRAQSVADTLTARFGIQSSRITVDSKGDMVQPYEQNNLNRVTICIAE